MNYLPDGTVTFNDIYDLYNELFMELGLYIGPDQYLYEQDTAMPIRLKDKFIKEWTLINLQIEYFYDEELINDDIDF